MKTDQFPVSKFNPRESASTNRRHPRAIVLVFLSLAGCGHVTATMPTPPADVPVVAIGTNHDPATCGRVTGTVTWAGELPTVPPLTIYSLTGTKPVPNPHSPAIDAATKRLGGAVVFLRGVDPGRARPWDTPDIVAEASDSGITFRGTGRIAFVRHGQTFQIRNEGTVSHVVRGRGAATFAVPLLKTADMAKRPALKLGIVHLTSGSNIAPASAYLFVCVHPYFTTTNADGTFAFEAVPDGEYELVVWHPNGNVIGHDRNPETGLINRYRFGEPIEKVTRVTVKAGGLTTVSLSFP